MPNWCFNQLEITSKNPAEIQKLVDAWDSGRFMQSLYPCPQELYDTIAGSYGDEEKQKELEAKEKANLEKYGYENWYDWCVDNWGTKWDIDTEAGESYVSGDTFYANFDTAWSPPIEFLKHLDGRDLPMGEKVDNDYYILCRYEEEGMGFQGDYNTEEGEWTSELHAVAEE
jgi:hypothetical protein